MKLKEMHKILKFKRSDWIKSFIDFNTDKRKEATNESRPTFVNWKVFENNLAATHEKNI